MKKQPFILFLVFISIIVLFFYKTFFSFYVPFPGDLLISEYNPWKSYSYLGYVPGSYPNKAQYFDVIRQMYPWKTLGLQQLKEWQLPLWNPYNFSGTPLLANFQSALLYPLNVVYIFLPQIVGWSMLVMLQPFLTLIFTYLYARKIELSVLASVFSAISFAFSSFMSVWLEYNTIGHVILWLPLLLLCIEHLKVKISPLFSIIFIFSLVSSFFAGHPQIFGYLLIFVIVYGYFQGMYNLAKQTRKRFLLFFTFLVFCGIGITAIKLLPGLELISNAARSNHDPNFFIQKILIQPWQLIMFLIPDFFGNPATRNYWPQDTYIGKMTFIGIIPIFFLTLMLIKKKTKIIWFYLFSSIILLLLTVATPFSQLLYSIQLPIIASSAPTLSLFLFCFSVSILAGFGLDLWQNKTQSIKKTLVWTSPIFFIFFLIICAILLFSKLNLFSMAEHSNTAFKNTALEIIIAVLGFVLIFSWTLRKDKKQLAIMFLVGLQLLDLWRFQQKFNPFSPRETIFPTTSIFSFLQKNAQYNRFWGYGTAAIDTNIATQFSLFSPEGYDPLYPKRYGELIAVTKNGYIQNSFTTSTRSDAVIAQGFGEEDLTKNNARQKILNLLGVKYILNKKNNGISEKIFPEEKFYKVYDEGEWEIFENRFVLPRVFLTSDYKLFHTNKEFEEIFFAKDFDPLKTILLEEKPILTISKEIQKQEVQINVYKPQEVIIKTKASYNSLLFLSDVYYPGWEAFIDGKKAPILRANYTFRAVAVPQGMHVIKFTYMPKALIAGVFISLISSIVAILFIYSYYKRYDKNHG